MDNFSAIQNLFFRYYGVDWLITFSVFASIFLLGDKKKAGFKLGMFASFCGIIFSFQIISLANGVASSVLFFTHLRGYLKWGNN